MNDWLPPPSPDEALTYREIVARIPPFPHRPHGTPANCWTYWNGCNCHCASVEDLMLLPDSDEIQGDAIERAHPW